MVPEEVILETSSFLESDVLRINTMVIYENQIISLYETIVVEDGGILIIQNCVVSMMGEHITVGNGGILTITNSSFSPGVQEKWYIEGIVGSVISISGSTLIGVMPSDVGLRDTFNSLVIGAYNIRTSIVNCTLSMCPGGGAVAFSDEVEFVDIRVSDVEVYGLRVGGESVTVSDCNIRNVGWRWDEGGYGIGIFQTVHAKISNNKINNVTQYGIFLQSSSDETGIDVFTNNTVDGEAISFMENLANYAVSFPVGQLIMNDCSNIDISGLNTTGIIVQNSDSITIRNCAVRHGGISLYEIDNVVVMNNSIFDTRGGEYAVGSIDLQSVVDAEITDNRISNTGLSRLGLSIRNSQNIAIQRNEIYDCGMGALHLWRSSYVDVIRNDIQNSTKEGVVVHESQFVTIEDNIIAKTALNYQMWYLSFAIIWDEFEYHYGGLHGNGLLLSESDNLLIENNSIDDSLVHGLVIGGVTNCNISDNEILNNGVDGLVLDFSDDPIIKNNRITNCGRNGVSIYESDGVTITGMVINEVSGIGYYWHDSPWPDEHPLRKFREFDNNTLDDEKFGLFQDEWWTEITGEDNLIGAILNNCSHSIIDGFDGNGLVISNSPYTIIRNSQVLRGGIKVSRSRTSAIIHCNISSTGTYEQELGSWGAWMTSGIFVYESHDTVVSFNNISESSGSGIVMHESYTESMSQKGGIFGNIIQNSSLYGIHIENLNSLSILGNSVTNTGSYALKITRSKMLEIYLNAFGGLDNNQVYMLSSIVAWDNGTHGNYWQFNVTPDNNGDGIGDSPIVLYHQVDQEPVIDRFPLTNLSLIDPFVEGMKEFGPSLIGVNVEPIDPTDGDIIIVEVELSTLFTGIRDVLLTYSTNAGLQWSNVTMTEVEGKWIAALPQQDGNSTIELKINVLDGLDRWWTIQSYSIHVAQIDVTTLVGIVLAVSVVCIISLAYVVQRRKGLPR
ncbi:MAG: right-handed parallel beta-helix repeat-containing protein [Candidatus Thorarchaeota archaeon]